jgi:hypothetical protein
MSTARPLRRPTSANQSTPLASMAMMPFVHEGAIGRSRMASRTSESARADLIQLVDQPHQRLAVIQAFDNSPGRVVRLFVRKRRSDHAAEFVRDPWPVERAIRVSGNMDDAPLVGAALLRDREARRPSRRIGRAMNDLISGARSLGDCLRS